jgi:hypothetical protein
VRDQPAAVVAADAGLVAKYLHFLLAAVRAAHILREGIAQRQAAGRIDAPRVDWGSV